MVWLVDVHALLLKDVVELSLEHGLAVNRVSRACKYETILSMEHGSGDCTLASKVVILVF